MPSRRIQSPASLPLSPHLRQLVRACEMECPAGHAAAFSALATLALHKVPARGIFDPGTREEPELYSAIDSIALTHLDLAEARRAWRAALKASNLALEQRDNLETAALRVQSEFDTAYFYTGLAFGLTFSSFHRIA